MNEKKRKRKRESLDDMSNDLELELHGKVFIAKRLIDFPMSRSGEVSDAQDVLKASETAEDRTAALLAFLQLCIPELSEDDLDKMTARQTEKLTDLLSEGLTVEKKGPAPSR